jgi:hypothetical protein
VHLSILSTAGPTGESESGMYRISIRHKSEPVDASLSDKRGKPAGGDQPSFRENS